jgi:hypothetical protein
MSRRLPVLVLLCASALVLWGRAAAAQEEQLRAAKFYWNPQQTGLYVDMSFRDLVDAEIQEKLSRGLPTKLILTGVLFQAGSDTPLASTYQSCKVTWHVWEEMYRVEINTPEQTTTRRHWTPTLTGVVRRCAEARGLLVAGPGQVAMGVGVLLRGTVRVNPVSDELLRKLKHWVSLPSRNAAATPGSALFSTFTGLFMQRIGDAERTLVFRTPVEVPR